MLPKEPPSDVTSQAPDSSPCDCLVPREDGRIFSLFMQSIDKEDVPLQHRVTAAWGFELPAGPMNQL